MIRGLPESVKEIQPAVHIVLKKLIPDHKLELDRALQPVRKDGLPRAIIVKPHYYSVKEEVMRAARANTKLTIREHQIQTFVHLSPSRSKNGGPLNHCY